MIKRVAIDNHTLQRRDWTPGVILGLCQVFQFPVCSGLIPGFPGFSVCAKFRGKPGVFSRLPQKILRALSPGTPGNSKLSAGVGTPIHKLYRCVPPWRVWGVTPPPPLPLLGTQGQKTIESSRWTLALTFVEEWHFDALIISQSVTRMTINH